MHHSEGSLRGGRGSCCCCYCGVHRLYLLGARPRGDLNSTCDNHGHSRRRRVAGPGRCKRGKVRRREMQLLEGSGLPPLLPLLSFPRINFPGTIWGPHCPLNLAYTPENLLWPPQLYRFLTTLVIVSTHCLRSLPRWLHSQAHKNSLSWPPLASDVIDFSDPHPMAMT